ncbi:aldehyde dehydrogenase, partial [Genlisea aurea]
LKVAVRRIISGKWGSNNGQTCISPDYLITTKDYASRVVDAISTELDNFYGKHPLRSHDLSRIVNPKHFERLLTLLQDEKVSCRIVRGGEHDRTTLRIAPTVIFDVPRDSVLMEDEIFGPLLPILTVERIEESLDVIDAKEKALAAYLFTNSPKLKSEFVRKVSAGAVCINETNLHFMEPSLPFGGVGESGMGAYHGKFSFEAFSHRKAVLERVLFGDVPARYPPYSRRKMDLLKNLLQGRLVAATQALLG